MDAEASLLGLRPVVPDDPHALVGLGRPERAGLAGRPELRRGAGAVLDVVLRDRDLVDRLAVAERDLAEGAAVVTVEREGDHLVDDQRPVRRDPDDDVRGRQRERLRGGVPGERERCEDRDQKGLAKRALSRRAALDAPMRRPQSHR